MVAAGTSAQPPSLASGLRDASHAVIGRAIDLDEDAIRRILSPRHFVEVRTTPGGPAPSETARAIAASECTHTTDQAWFSETMGKLEAAETALEQAVASL
jgi:argininosuccinate lyase